MQSSSDIFLGILSAANLLIPTVTNINFILQAMQNGELMWCVSTGSTENNQCDFIDHLSGFSHACFHSLLLTIISARTKVVEWFAVFA
jgi:hypothetical protein